MWDWGVGNGDFVACNLIVKVTCLASEIPGQARNDKSRAGMDDWRSIPILGTGDFVVSKLIVNEIASLCSQ